ncbi:DUF1349 domain-containing protein [Streptomyces sp. MP131-18]|uniref:DUF1349 domain-containing protein n=1 Tax=Streptomyces sp. MP131-18 TaxID=1857892 RepID=UPI00097BE88E|nr:DUF1349 domain-containing protein [Streptomyces sp. MP131-18]ONK16011.1 hypothetical protein STBA_68610 [Streptomyces sp. MP131-18]
MEQQIRVPAVPVPLRPLNRPADWSVDGDGALTLGAGAGTDLFSDPGGPGRFANAPALIGRVEGDFVLTARVTTGLAATYDAGVLLLYAGEDNWAKLCLELSPQGAPTVVSVVTRGVSDDCNGLTLDSGEAWLRIARIGPAYAFHASADGGFWHLVRYFALTAGTEAGPGPGPGQVPEVGFLAQSPTGAGNTVRFSDVECAPRTLADLRGGG